MAELGSLGNIPPFTEVFPRLFGAYVKLMSADQLAELANDLSPEARLQLAACLGEQGLEQVLGGASEDKRLVLSEAYPAQAAAGPLDGERFAALYPEVMLATNTRLTSDQLRQALGGLSQEEIASQSIFLGNQGRRFAFGRMRHDAVEAMLDHTDDWVLLESGKQALAQFGHYTATFIKQERLKGKLQPAETIQLKYREQPRAFYLKWLAGPYKGRAVLYNEALLGPGRMRVREAGLLGVAAVTIGVDSPVARRGSKHTAIEVGLSHLVSLMERDYKTTSAAGHLRRVNHGIVDLDGVPVYKMESVMPSDPAAGYYCHRMTHYTDFARGFEVKCEIFNFDNQLDESYYYKDLDLSPGLKDLDFDPKNRKYRL